jgi:hypothetical protein
LAYLAADRASDAAAEFQRLINQAQGSTALASVAQIGRARALARVGDLAGSRSAYQDFFAAWKDADADVPLLTAGKQEYGRLSRTVEGTGR